jgi:peptidoglycan hydrolase-like protein with peptidoglycan-binding domain
MSCNNILESLVASGNIGTVLTEGPPKKTEITDFQKILHQLGFDDELNYSNYGADGYYGASVTNAVAAYCVKNGITSDGKTMTDAIANAMIAHYDTLDEMQDLAAQVAKGSVESRLYEKCTDKVSVAAMQTLLNEMGFGTELNWDKYHNDGYYEASGIAAVAAHAAKAGIASDGKKLTTELAQKILDALSPSYGADYAANTKSGMDAATQSESTSTSSSGGTATVTGDVMTTFTGSNFSGTAVTCDVLFVPYLEKVNEYAKANHVSVYVTSSYREDSNVAGAIVVPATKSNHMAGHAIDMNIDFSGGFANSAYLKESESTWDPAVKGFIDAIRADSVLRWGGDFNTPDVVHIDDELNLRDPDQWEARYIAMQEASVNG